MHIVIDCCLTTDWQATLQGAGYDAVYWSDVGEAAALDQQIADWAAQHDRIVLTQDLDFGALLATQQRTKPSVMQIRSDSPTPEDVGALVLQALKTYEAELGKGAIVTVHPGHARFRLLPLK